jgi:hypothetical protein
MIAGMTVPPTRSRANHVVALDYEIVQEQAAALGRLGRALEAALAALAAHDSEGDSEGAGEAGSASVAGQSRAELVGRASHALWCFLVQRECCGLRDARAIIAAYRVPPDVHNRIGAFPPGGMTGGMVGTERRRGKG